MQNRGLSALILVLVACSSCGAELLGVAYECPKGWTEASEGAAKVFKPNGLKDGELVIVIVTPAGLVTGTPAKQFETTVASTIEGIKVTERGLVQSREQAGQTVCAQMFRCRSDDVGDHVRIYTMIFSPKAQALAIAILKPDTMAERHGGGIASLVGSLSLKDAVDAKPVAPKPGDDKTPTGDTPKLHPGMPGWLPSGKGIKIPAPEIADGRPQGMWWTTSYAGGLKAATFVFLTDGTHASSPRFGGGMLVDIDAQKAQPGANGVGPFSVKDGQITREYDGHKSVDPFRHGKDDSGIYFKIGEATYKPLAPVASNTIVGTWTVTGTRYVFNADGTYRFGHVAEGDGWAAGSVRDGRYSLDDYLVVLRPAKGEVEITPMGLANEKILLINGLFYVKQ